MKEPRPRKKERANECSLPSKPGAGLMIYWRQHTIDEIRRFLLAASSDFIYSNDKTMLPLLFRIEDCENCTVGKWRFCFFMLNTHFFFNLFYFYFLVSIFFSFAKISTISWWRLMEKLVIHHFSWAWKYTLYIGQIFLIFWYICWFIDSITQIFFILLMEYIL